MADKQNYFTYIDNTSGDTNKTYKQTIIDGVDVSGCYCYVSTSKEYSCGLTCSNFHYRHCSDNPNCYYKQLKRKEQECEELKEANNTLTMTREKLLGDLWITEESLKDYEAHYNRQCEQVDKLEEQLEAYKMEAEEGKEINAELEAMQKDLEQKLEQSEQKLKKIKEIVNTHKQNKCVTCSEFDKCLGHPYCDEVILKIIEE